MHHDKSHVSGNALTPPGYLLWSGLHCWSSRDGSGPWSEFNLPLFCFVLIGLPLSHSWFSSSNNFLYWSCLSSFFCLSRFQISTRMEVSWGAPLGPFLLSPTASVGKVKIFLSEAMGNIGGRVSLGCHRLVTICHTVHPGNSAATMLCQNFKLQPWRSHVRCKDT